MEGKPFFFGSEEETGRGELRGLVKVGVIEGLREARLVDLF